MVEQVSSAVHGDVFAPQEVVLHQSVFAAFCAYLRPNITHYILLRYIEVF